MFFMAGLSRTISRIALYLWTWVLEPLSLLESRIAIHPSPPCLLKRHLSRNWVMCFRPFEFVQFIFSCHLVCFFISCIYCKLKFISKYLVDSQVEGTLAITDDAMSFILYHIESYRISTSLFWWCLDWPLKLSGGSLFCLLFNCIGLLTSESVLCGVIWLSEKVQFFIIHSSVGLEPVVVLA